MKHTKPSGAGLGALLCALLIGAPGADAQEQPQQPELQPCSATITPAQIERGQEAVELTAMVSEPLGEITEVETPEGSGLEIASPEDLPRQDMAATERPQPVTLGEQGDRVTVWLNTAEAQPGEYQLTFHGADGQCSGTVVIR